MAFNNEEGKNMFGIQGFGFAGGAYGIGGFGGFGGMSGAYGGFHGMNQFANLFGGQNYSNSFAQSGSTSYVPNLQIGQHGYGQDSSWSRSVSESGQQNMWGGEYNRAEAGAYQNTMYEYDKQKAVDYHFQQGQQWHNKDVQQTRTERSYDPVILDLNGDGQLDVTGKDNSLQNVNHKYSTDVNVQRSNRRETTTTTKTHEWDTQKDWNNKINYDVDGDGKTDRTEWMKKGSQDGLLVWDANKDGKITGNELMNESTIDGKQGAYKSGWEKTLALGDANKDGKIDANEMKNFSVWVDKNGDGVTDAGELQTAQQMGIMELNPQEGSFTRRKEIAQESGSYANAYSGGYDAFGNSWGNQSKANAYNYNDQWGNNYSQSGSQANNYGGGFGGYGWYW